MNIAMNFNQASHVASDLGNDKRKLNSYSSSIRSVIRQCPLSGKTRAALVLSLNKLAIGIDQECTELGNMQNALNASMQMYQMCEQNLARCEGSTSLDWDSYNQETKHSNNSGKHSATDDHERQGGGGGRSIDSEEDALLDWLKERGIENIPPELSGLTRTLGSMGVLQLLKDLGNKDSGVTLTALKIDDIKIDGDTLNDLLEQAGMREEYKYGDKEGVYYDEDGNQIRKEDAPTFYEKDLSILEIKKKVSAEESLYEDTFDVGQFGNLAMVVGQAEAHAEVSAGLYVLSSDGSKKFSPGVNAEMGASVTALSFDGENQLVGNENLGLYSDAKVTVGKAEAKADVGAQIFGEDGELDVQLGAKASAEVIAAKVESSIGANVLGGKVGVNGSVSVGVGAHADVGYRDGVFKFDVGASLGIGASFGGEIDIGGMVDNVCDAASSAWSDLEDGWNALWNK